MSELREYVVCRLCGTDDYSVVYEWSENYYDHSIYETASWDGRQSIPLRICRCNTCGLAYSNPSFKKENLHLVYPKDLIPSHENIQLQDDFLKLLNIEKYADLYNLLKNRLTEGSTILDIGTRYGGLPYYLRECGHQAYGVELNESSVNLANKFGLDYILKGTIDQVKDHSGAAIPSHFDCIILDDVLEHLVEPLEDLKQISVHQDKGGIVVMRQMDWDGIGHKIFRGNWYYLQPAAHMSFFSPETAGKLLRKCGYHHVEVLNKNNAINILRTAARYLKKKLWGGGQWKTETDKVMYLQERNKMYDDMFTIIGIK